MKAEDILSSLSSLLEEVQLDGRGGFRVPPEMRPSTQKVTLKEADKAITTSLEVVFNQMLELAYQLRKENKDYRTRLDALFNEWPTAHPDHDLTVFYYLKFRIDARLDSIDPPNPDE